MNNENRIVKVKKNGQGSVTDVMFESGRVCPLNFAILMAKNGAIDGFNVVRGKNGGEYLSADPNSSGAGNLNNMPTFR
ncbi:uncharacterized protein DUF3892 [Ruminiclostridium sufflavum DSM 19573]|uniref:Uncharacterized protein DUF3892 n=1 Tax=Ruminiclostridium sufflavum DSM 19573 TaxID=1121337 RepID=A0A318Y9F8_9FIRM|nr:DUF3892 domain-containing protein [Ruminiclostridium sufflavum]PYG89033.1 uncharacterized protein DUF3892 [Ruminiclostridium sufflavum DSM 19573]